MLANKLMSAMSALSGGGEERLYVDDVFSTYLYTGNGATQTINNGIDLAGKGGLVWIKNRTSVWEHILADTASGTTKYLNSNTTQGYLNAGAAAVNSFNSNGFGLGSYAANNGSGNNLVSWTFRKAPKFFDVVTWTGNGVNSRTVAHALGSVPGMIILKRTDSASDWPVVHRGNGTTGQSGGFLNQTSIFYPDASYAIYGDASTITPANINGSLNVSGATYIAYLFAHDPSVDGIIQCGSFTTDASGNATVSLGWEPQYLIAKRTTSAQNWLISDNMRGMSIGAATSSQLFSNTSDAEYAAWTGEPFHPSATGFKTNTGSGGFSAAVHTYIYLAIRRPNKPPTTGTQVYNAIARTGNNTANTVVSGLGFPPDFLLASHRPGGGIGCIFDKLRGRTQQLQPSQTAAEITSSGTTQDLQSFDMDGVTIGTWNISILNRPDPIINHFFRRAPGFFDVVCYTGDGVSGRLLPHNLTVQPELIISKNRSGTAADWEVIKFASGVTTTSGTNYWFNHISTSSALYTGTLTGIYGSSMAAPTASTYPVGYVSGNANGVNVAPTNYVAYLFATKAGISKVGSYTGNGTTQTINCGFTTGARFILIKRTDSAGDWYVWDTARGIVSANDPHLSLNTVAAEVTTDDSVDPDVSGFVVNQVAATNINVSGGQYIFLSVA